MNTLFDISENLITSNFQKVRHLIWDFESSDFEKTYDITNYEFDIHMYFASMRPPLSYGQCIALAYRSLIHENYILYYLTLKYLIIDICSSHRLFYDDVFMIKQTLIYMAEKINRTRSYIDRSCNFELYYNDCIKEYYPIGDCIRTKYDYEFLGNSKYNLEVPSSKLLSDDLDTHVQAQTLKSYIYELDNYINKFGNQTKASTTWEYLFIALFGNFFYESFPHCPWNRHFSESLLKTTIGYSKCFDHKKITSYTLEMRKFVLGKLEAIEKITAPHSLVFLTEEINDSHFLEAAIFLINLYYIFPFSEIIDCCETILSKNASQGICYKFENTYNDIKKHISLLKSNDDDCGNFFHLYTTSTETKITNVEIVKQSEVPKFTRIQLEIDMVDSFNIDVQLKFYNKDDQQICNDKPFVLSFSEDDFEERPCVYETTILEGSLIHRVEAQITKKRGRGEHSDSIKKTTNQNTLSTDDNPEDIWEDVINCILLLILGMIVIFFIGIFLS